MSEKRFTVDGLNIKDNSIKGRLYLLEEQGGVNALCNLINGLTNKINRLEEENEQLKSERRNDAKEFSALFKQNCGLKRENERLKKENEELEISIKLFEDDVKRLQEENEQLKERLEKINGGYGHLTHRNGLTANEWLIQSQEKELKKKDERISEWIKQHAEDIAKISKQNKLIQNLKEENEQLQEKNEELKTMIMNDILDKYKIAFEEVKRGADILRDLCPTCIYFINYEAEVSSEGYVRTTKCIKRGKVKGVLNECDDYKKEWSDKE